MRDLRAEPLTQEAFAPFGDVVSVGRGTGKDANQGTALRFDWVSELGGDRGSAKANLVVVRSTPVALPFQVKLLERHPHSTQLFVPMRCASFLVMVAPALLDGSPDLGGLKVFRCTAGQGINYKKGAWHHPILALDEPAEFAMVVWEDGTPADCVERGLGEQIRVV